MVRRQIHFSLCLERETLPYTEAALRSALPLSSINGWRIESKKKKTQIVTVVTSEPWQGIHGRGRSIRHIIDVVSSLTK